MRVETLSEFGGVTVSPEAGETLAALDINAIIPLYKGAGAVYFAGFDADVADFEAFTNRFSEHYMDNKGSGSYRTTADKSQDGTIQNVGYVYGVDKQRTFPLPLHADRSYVKSQPELMWFLCRRPCECGGGQTTVCDGVAAWRAFSEATRQAFRERRLKYIRHYPAGEWEVLFHTADRAEVERYCADNDLAITFHDDGSASTEYFKPAFVTPKYTDQEAFVNSILIQQWQEDDLKRPTTLVRMEDGERIPDEVLDDVCRASESVTINLPWHAGDFVMVDNTRMLHGRRAFTDQNREIYVRMCRKVDW